MLEASEIIRAHAFVPTRVPAGPAPIELENLSGCRSATLDRVLTAP